MLSTPAFALKSGPQIAQPFVSFVTKSRSECRMVGKSSISGGEVQVFESLNGIRHLAETGRFKAWFLDQFGVLHDGKHPYPGAITTLEKLASYGAKMVIISNSSRRASTTIEKLKSLGFDTSLFFGAITSGELTHQYLQRRDDSWFATLGRSCIHMTWSDRGAISLEGLGLQVVESIEDANFILAHGTEALGLPSGDARPMKLEDLEHVLELCAEYKIPMVVANPDYVTVEARDLHAMPGMLAAKYEKLGGEVKWMGKPDEVLQNHGFYSQDHGEAFPALRPMTNCSQVCTGLIACCSNAVQLVGPTGSMPFIGVQQMEMPSNFTAPSAFNPMVKTEKRSDMFHSAEGTECEGGTLIKVGPESWTTYQLTTCSPLLADRSMCAQAMNDLSAVIYQSVIAMTGVDASDCIAVGDSLHHDIKGANAAGIQSVLITGGIHATELGLGSFGEAADSAAVEALASKYNAHPSYVLPAFTW